MTTQAANPRSDFGVVYVAAGEVHRRDAEKSALTVRQHNPGLQLCLFSDTEPGPGIFDIFIQIEKPHRRSKLDCMPKSPFQRTLYLDNDTAVVGPISEPFELLDRYHLAICHMKNRHPRITEGKYRSSNVPTSFYPMNSGVVYFRKCPEIDKLFEEWVAAYQATDLVRDQVVLREILWARKDLNIYILPFEYNIREIARLVFLNREWQQPRVLHFDFYKSRFGFFHKLKKFFYRLPGPVSIARNVILIVRSSLSQNVK